MPHQVGSIPHMHHPCDRCGYATRYKQFSLVCECTTPDRCPHPPSRVVDGLCRRCGGDATESRKTPNKDLQQRISQIEAEKQPLNAAQEWRSGPAPQVAPRYAAGPPRPQRR